MGNVERGNSGHFRNKEGKCWTIKLIKLRHKTRTGILQTYIHNINGFKKSFRPGTKSLLYVEGPSANNFFCQLLNVLEG